MRGDGGMEKVFDKEIIRAIQEAQKKSGLDLRKHCPFEWRFTDDEKNSIQNLFYRRGVEKGVGAFIERIEPICHAEMLLHGQRTPEQIERETLKILRDLKNILATIEMIYSLEIRLSRLSTIPSKQTDFKSIKRYGFGPHYGLEDKQISEPIIFDAVVSGKAWVVIHPLRDLIQTIEARPKVKRDRKGPPGNVSKLEVHILKIFRETVGKQPEILFSDIMEVIREAVNRPHSDITRTLKKLRYHDIIRKQK
jgi:hypothetical protein